MLPARSVSRGTCLLYGRDKALLLNVCLTWSTLAGWNESNKLTEMNILIVSASSGRPSHVEFNNLPLAGSMSLRAVELYLTKKKLLVHLLQLQGPQNARLDPTISQSTSRHANHYFQVTTRRAIQSSERVTLYSESISSSSLRPVTNLVSCFARLPSNCDPFGGRKKEGKPNTQNGNKR